MAIIRRQATPLATPSKKTPILGENRMRRVWNKDDPLGATRSDHKYWYVDAHSREGAINFMARALRRKAETFDAEKD